MLTNLVPSFVNLSTTAMLPNITFAAESVGRLLNTATDLQRCAGLLVANVIGSRSPAEASEQLLSSQKELQSISLAAFQEQQSSLFGFLKEASKESARAAHAGLVKAHVLPCSILESMEFEKSIASVGAKLDERLEDVTDVVNSTLQVTTAATEAVQSVAKRATRRPSKKA